MLRVELKRLTASVRGLGISLRFKRREINLVLTKKSTFGRYFRDSLAAVKTTYENNNDCQKCNGRSRFEARMSVLIKAQGHRDVIGQLANILCLATKYYG